jgi:hypothetical protein
VDERLDKRLSSVDRVDRDGMIVAGRQVGTCGGEIGDRQAAIANTTTERGMHSSGSGTPCAAPTELDCMQDTRCT